MGSETSEGAEVHNHMSQILETAAVRASFTRRYLAEKHVDIKELVQTLGQAPFRITIQDADHASLVKGVYALQRHLGLSDLDTAQGCDGKFGPHTYKKFREYLAHQASRAELKKNKTVVSPVAQFQKLRGVLDIREQAPGSVPLSETAFVGDSLTVCMRSSLKGAAHINKGGMRTDWMQKNLANFLENSKSKKIKRVVILGGFNDMTSAWSVDTITRNLGAMYAMARKAGKSVVACTLPQWDAEQFLSYVKPIWKKRGWGKNGVYPLDAAELRRRTDQINRWILAQRDVAHVDLDQETRDVAKYHRGDFVHYYGKNAANMAALIQEKGKIA